MSAEYRYLGDRLTRPELKGALCRAVHRPDGKCITDRLGGMLVEFAHGRERVLRRMLRKMKP